MNRTRTLLAGMLAGGACLAAGASAQGSSATGHVAKAARVQSRKTALGRILVNGSGSTLYRFTKDSSNKDRCAAISGCLEAWPALSTSGKPTAGPGVKASLLSTIRLPGGARQVTYAGHPLYTFSSASEPGETSYAGVMEFGGSWDAVNTAGASVK
jgi:predicted lipoprotein with Yx(FWY)xxD motif